MNGLPSLLWAVGVGWAKILAGNRRRSAKKKQLREYLADFTMRYTRAAVTARPAIAAIALGR